MSRWSFSIAAALAAAMWLSGTPASAIPRVGEPAPALSLPTAAGRSFAVSSLRGRAVYVNFYATWCGPCNDEAPAIGRLSAKYRSRGLTVIGVNELETAKKAIEFTQRYRLPYDSVVDADGTAGKVYGALGLPVHVFIDRSGVVRTYRLGEMSAAEIETAIRDSLASTGAGDRR